MEGGCPQGHGGHRTACLGPRRSVPGLLFLLHGSMSLEKTCLISKSHGECWPWSGYEEWMVSEFSDPEAETQCNP